MGECCIFIYTRQYEFNVVILPYTDIALELDMAVESASLSSLQELQRKFSPPVHKGRPLVFNMRSTYSFNCLISRV